MDGVLPTTGRGRSAVIAVLALALGLRIGAVYSYHHYVPLTDAVDFDRIATSLADGHGFGNAILLNAKGPGALRAPLYPFSLSLVYDVFGDHKWTMGRLANAAIGTVLVGLIGLIGAQLWSRRVALVAMFLAAVHPALIVIGSGLQLEPLLVTLSLGALAAALQHRRATRGLWWPATAGLLMGLA